MSLQWFFCWSASLDGGARLLLVGTYRDVELSRQHPLAEALGELTRERLFQRVLLRGLAQQDVGRFVELVAGIAPPQGMVEAVYRQTEGNPLFVTEVVRLLVQEGELSPEDLEKAISLLDESLVISTELSMRPLVERVNEGLEPPLRITGGIILILS